MDLVQVDNRSPQYLTRVAFDLSFFVLVGVILFNVITGLMVDTFSSLREEAAERADSLSNECFVCGFRCRADVRLATQDLMIRAHSDAL